MRVNVSELAFPWVEMRQVFGGAHFGIDIEPAEYVQGHRKHTRTGTQFTRPSREVTKQRSTPQRAATARKRVTLKELIDRASWKWIARYRTDKGKRAAREALKAILVEHCYDLGKVARTEGVTEHSLRIWMGRLGVALRGVGSRTDRWKVPLPSEP